MKESERNGAPMGKIVKFQPRPKTVKDTDHSTFTSALDADIEKLSNATGISKEDAIKMASDFYRRYPMLIEHVRSPEFMFRG